MVTVIFRSTIRQDADMTAMEAMGTRMHALASAMPGFVAYKEFVAEDGEYLTLVHFKDEASLLAWRHQPEHVQGQETGRQAFFDAYHIQVCKTIREYAFDQSRGRTDLVQPPPAP
jgi:heme-degrading monooxygenase HmoA